MDHGGIVVPDRVEIVKEIYAAFGTGDINAVFARLTDDVDWSTEADSTTAPWFGPRKGKEAVGAFFEALGKTSEVTEFTPLAVAAGGDDVLAVVRIAYTVRATGKSTVTNQHHWWRFAGDQVSFYRGTEDTEQTAKLLEV
jgi:ketosteroid isomerase-like protein